MASARIALGFPMKEWVFLNTFPFARIASAALGAHVFLRPVASLALYLFSISDFLVCTMQCFVEREAHANVDVFTMEFHPFTLFV